MEPPRRQKLVILAVIALIHIAVIAGLIRAFTPDLPAQIARQVVAAFDVTVETKEYKEEPEPKAANAAPKEAGAAGEAGKKAKPKEVAAPDPKIRISNKPAPKVAGAGNENRSGARDAGDGTGAGGQGQGTGAGGSGSGQGGGGGIATKAVKVSGDINSARDYPKKSRDLRLGDHVIVALKVGTDGRVKACRVHRASRDAEADRITCQLATQRFRFEPAKTASGTPVESEYGWKQEWFRPT
ncbi:MAG: TonB family protein [Xanthobacteraceae bacterium]